MRAPLDPFDAITAEVIRHALTAASREMGVTLRKTSCSPIFNEGNDYSCAIFDAEAELVTHGEFLPIHLGSLSVLGRHARAAFADGGLAEGDTVIINDPYRGGSHLPDITMVSPIFHGGRVWSATRRTAPTTWTSAARCPGSFYAGATRELPGGPADHAR